MVYRLEKPYTEFDRTKFICIHNNTYGRRIEETEEFLYALEDHEVLINDEVVDKTEEIQKQLEEEAKQRELVRLQNLKLTACDVERAIYKAKQMDFDDIVEYISSLENCEIDLKELKIELKANYFYRKNPYVDSVGKLLGFTPEMLDRFFDTNDYKHLIPIT